MATEQVLVVVTPSVAPEQLSEAVPPDRLRGTDVKLVVPAITGSALSFWLSDQRAITRARKAADAAREAIGDQAASVTAVGGDCDPVLAVEDAIATFDPDAIIVIHRADHPGYREEKLDRSVLEPRIGRDVEEHLID